MEVGKTKQNKKKRNISSHPTYVRRVTFRSQGSKALRAYNQYYIFHCHLHSYCKWLVSKIITGCIRNLGFAISLLVLGGPVCSPSLTPAPLGVNDAAVADTSHTTTTFLPSAHSLSLYSWQFWELRGKCVCVRKRLVLEMISPLCMFRRSASNIVLLAGLERLNLFSLLLSLHSRQQ